MSSGWMDIFEDGMHKNCWYMIGRVWENEQTQAASKSFETEMKRIQVTNTKGKMLGHVDDFEMILEI